nr:glycosyltransferase family 39 protein [bacterium]
MNRNRERWIVLAVLALGAVFRAAWLKSLAGTPYLSVPSLDAGYYLSWAESLAWGGGGSPAGFAGNPLYPYLLSLCLRIFGSIALPARAAQAGLGVLTCLLAWKTGRETAGTAVGLAAAAICAGAGILVFYEAWLLPVTLEVFCLAAAAAALATAARTGSTGAWFAAGLAVGAGFLARGTLVPAAAFLAAAAAPGRKARALAALAAGTIVVPALFFLGPGAGAPLVPAHSGENFYIGNRAGAAGVGNIPEFARALPELMHEDFRAEAVRRGGRPLDPGQSSAYWWREGLAFIGSRPFSFLGLALKKILLFFSGGEYPDNYHPAFFRERWPPLGILSWRLIAALGLAGMAAPRDRRRFLPLYLLCGTWVLGVSLFFVVDRLRAPLVPALAVFGAEAAAGVFRALRRKRAAAAGGRAALAAGLFFLLGIPGPGTGTGQFLLQAAEINYR